MIRGLQGEEWKFIQKYLKENISRGVGKNRAKFAPRMGYANFEGVMRISHNTLCRAKFSHNLEQLASKGHIFLISAPNRNSLKRWILNFQSFEMVYSI